MRKYKLWFIIVVAFLWVLGADCAFYILTGMTFFDPSPTLQGYRFGALVLGAWLTSFAMITSQHLKDGGKS